MMRALLVYCYANGVFGSRRIEAATYRDIAVRYLCADTHPDQLERGTQPRHCLSLAAWPRQGNAIPPRCREQR